MDVKGSSWNHIFQKRTFMFKIVAVVCLRYSSWTGTATYNQQNQDLQWLSCCEEYVLFKLLTSAKFRLLLTARLVIVTGIVHPEITILSSLVYF